MPHQRRLSLTLSILLGVAVIVALDGVDIVPDFRAATTMPSIPDTNYSIPAGAVFMSPNGSDSNPGTQASPVKTLNSAVSNSASGGTIVMRGGTYRDWYNNGSSFATLTKAITIQAYPHEQPWFDGTDVVSTGWTGDGAGHFTHVWATPAFCSNKYYDRPWSDSIVSGNDGPCTHYDMHNGTAGDPQMVFVDGMQLTEVATLAQVTPRSFYYAQDIVNKTGVLYLGIDPRGHTVELSARPSAIYNEVSPLELKGIGFRRYATNEFDEVATQSAVFTGGDNALIENVVFYENAAAGYTNVGSGGVVRGSIFQSNGFNGANGDGHASTGGADNIVVEHSIFDLNNTLNFGTACNESCSQAGWKTAHIVGAVIQNNVFSNNQGYGWWCDLNCSDVKFTNNVIFGNTRDGIFYEISKTGIIASNVVYGNGGGISVGSGSTKVYNNTVVNNDAGILIFDDDRSPGIGGWSATQVAPDTTDDHVVNNIIHTKNGTDRCGRQTLLSACNAGGQTTAPRMLPTSESLDHNLYLRPSGTPTKLLSWDTTAGTMNYDSVSAVRTTLKRDLHSIGSTSPLTSVFSDPAAGDYRLAIGSVADNAGRPLTSDVASALGVTAGAAVDMGALAWADHGSAPHAPTPTPTDQFRLLRTPSLRR
jgi:parallel beta-helix repeat protein